MTTPLQTEAIVLHTLPFKDYDRIVTVFTPQEGLIKLFVKGSKKGMTHLFTFTTPYTVVELLYTPTSSGLYRLFEGSLIKQHLPLRDSFSSLQTAERLGTAILSSQWQGKASPTLYALLCSYLDGISTAENHHAISASFLLKVLRHDGLLQLSSTCSICHCLLVDGMRYRGERFCNQHAPHPSHPFSDPEEKILSFLAFSRSFEKIGAFPCDEELLNKVIVLFKQSLEE